MTTVREVFGAIFIILLYFLNRVKLIDLESFVEEIDREYQKD
jgi:hypothetical protein